MNDKNKLFNQSYRMGFRNIIKYLVPKYKININMYEEAAFTRSCYYGHIETIKYLIELANQPNYQQINIHANDEEVFRWSCDNGHINVTKYLIEIGKKPAMIPFLERLIAIYYPKN